jgi:uncharacterized membrane protein
MLSKKNVNLLTIIIIAFIFIFIGGVLFDLSNNQESHTTQPLYWPLAIGFSSSGGALLIGIFLRTLLPFELLQEIQELKTYII